MNRRGSNGCRFLGATSGAESNSRRPQLLRGAICDFQFAAAREATIVRKARMRSAIAPLFITGALASPLALLKSTIPVRVPVLSAGLNRQTSA